MKENIKAESKRTIVIGHKNPDTDSICSAIAYARLKQKITGTEFMPARAGEINGETKYVLDYFKEKKPKNIRSVRTQVKDIDIRILSGLSKNVTVRNAWDYMKCNGIKTIPITSGKELEGIVTVGDITKSYMGISDCRMLLDSGTRYSSIAETLGGLISVGHENKIFVEGKVLIATDNPDKMESYIDKGDLIILGNRYESQLCAIEMEAGCIVVCEGAGISMTISKIAKENGCTVITTPHDTYTVARLINQSVPVNYLMTRDDILAFHDDDPLEEVKETMSVKRHRYFPVLDEEGNYKGMISRRNLLGAKGKKVILVDHNEASQAVDGIEACDLLEIIDHHRLGSVETMHPIYFRNQPLGCTATIIYLMYKENNVDIDKNTAGLLCSAIISDTLLLRSPTCTPLDKTAAGELAKIAEIELEEYAKNMFRAGSNLKGKSVKEVFYQDFKRFTSDKISFGVGQINSLNDSELKLLKQDMLPFMKEVLENSPNLDMVFFMLTSILEESTDLLYCGGQSEQIIKKTFFVETSDNSAYLPNVVSRKKQLIPTLVMGLQK